MKGTRWGLLLCAALAAGARAGDRLYEARPLTPAGGFTEGIEGPACDRAGNIYAVNFARQRTIGRTTPRGKSEVFVTLPGRSTGNGIRFDRSGKMYVADYVGHNVLRVSPDGKTLYVNESLQRNIWAFTITPEGVRDKRLVSRFPDHGFDGMRADVDGNLYVTRHGKGTVAVVSPAGQVLREITVPGTRPSNLCFGGPDGRTVYVTEVDHRRLVHFRVERPGLEWQRWRTP
jgi:DNA-binding beta-propeller fold protein YncE